MKHVSAMQWFRYASNDLSFAEWVGLGVHTASCSQCRAQWREQRRLAAMAPVPGAESSRHHWVLASAAVVLSLVVWVSVGGDTAGSDLRPKGASLFQLYLAGSGASLGSTCQGGDKVQATVKSERRYVIVLLKSADGSVQVLHPSGGAVSVEVSLEQPMLPQRWELDDSPGEETFVALFSHEPVSASEAVNWVKSGSWPSSVEHLERACVKSRGDGR